MNADDLERELASATAGIHPPASAWSQIAHRGRVRRVRRVAVSASIAVSAIFTGGIALANNQWLASGPPPLAATASPQDTSTPGPKPIQSSPSRSASPAPTVTSTVLAMDHDYWFASPSGNISCYLGIDYGSVECETREHLWRAPAPKPGQCDFGDWATSVVVDSGKARFTCETDTVFINPPVVLPYGTTLRSGSIDCTSSIDGMHCQRRGTAHGFFLSRARYELT